MLRRRSGQKDARGDAGVDPADTSNAVDVGGGADENDEADTPDELDVIELGDTGMGSDEGEGEGEGDYGVDDFADEYEEAPRDPIVGWMTLVSILLVLVVVVATGSIVFFLLGMRGAPRTAVERQVVSAEVAASAEPTDKNLQALGYAYLSAGRYRDALSAASRGRKAKDSSIFDLLEGDVLRMQGDHERAVKMYEKAAKRNEAEVKKEVEALAKRGIFSPVSRTTYVSIMIGKGESLVELRRPKEALAAFEDAVKHESTNAYALTRVGDLNAELGKAKDAREAYKEALRFIPDYERALDGLENVDNGLKE